MTTFETLIDDVLERLADDGTLFSRSEILKWLSEGYRRLTNQTRHARTFTAMDMPPRHYTAVTFDWEQGETTGPSRKWTYTHRSGLRECTFLWEAQQESATTPSNRVRAVSNLWELSSGEGEVDAHYRFVLPENESVVSTVWHDHDKLTALTASVLDTLEDRWWSIDGEPFAWTQTLGAANSFEVFEIEAAYQQAYRHIAFEWGGPRGFSGSRDYTVDSEVISWGYAYSWTDEPRAPTEQLDGIGRRFTQGPEGNGFYYTHDWEGQQHRNETITESSSVVETNPFRYSADGVESITAQLEVGLLRRVISTERMYQPSHQWDVYGIPRTWASSDNNILVYHSVNAETAMSEKDELALIPDQVTKYIIFYALGILFNRQGEGYDPALATHYLERAARGIFLMQRLRNITRIAEAYTRSQPSGRSRSRASLPRLPSNFPRAPWLRGR